MVAVLKVLNSLTILATTALAQSTNNLASPVGIGCGLGEYPLYSAASQPAYRTTFSDPMSSFISLRFTSFNIPFNDYVKLSSASNKNTTPVYLYGNSTSGSFIASPVLDSSIVVELYTYPQNPTLRFSKRRKCVGFVVTGYISRINTFSNPKNETICGLDETRNAICASPIMFNHGKPVARMIITKNGGQWGCTGWLVGGEGHLITNHHCIEEPSQINNLRIEFNAQGSRCQDNCKMQLACPGQVYTGRVQFVYTSSNNDFTIIQLETSYLFQYGFLQLRVNSSPVGTRGEQVYIVEHPMAFGKQIASKASGQDARLVDIVDNQYSYYLDTQSMASGSVVLSSVDHSAVALHHGGATNCPNYGIQSNIIYAELYSQNILPESAWFYGRNRK